jgi:hypothetical protein
MSFNVGDEFTLDLEPAHADRFARDLRHKGIHATVGFTVPGKKVTGHVETIDMSKHRANCRVIAVEPLH